MKKRILIIGGTSTELSLRASRLANGNEEINEPLDYELAPSGAAGIAAITISRLGEEAIVCTALGDDEYGRSIISLFKGMGIDTRFVKTVKGAKTDVSVVVEDEDDRETYRSNALLSHIDLDLVEDALTTIPDAIYCSLDVSPEVAAKVAEFSRENKVIAFFDGERLPEGYPIENLGVIDLIALPPHITERLTGISPRSAQSNLEAAVELHKTLRSKTYIFKYGIGGAFAYKGNFSYYIPYVEGADVRYRDMFVPAMIPETLRSAKTVRAARYASTVIEVASKRGNLPAAAAPTETAVLQYVLANDIEF